MPYRTSKIAVAAGLAVALPNLAAAAALTSLTEMPVSATWSGGLGHSPNERFSLALGAFTAPGNTFWSSEKIPAPASTGIASVALAAMAVLRRRRVRP